MFDFIGNLLSGGMGAGFQAQGANILNPTTTAQANQANNLALNPLQSQIAFANAVGAQNGLGNLSNVYNQYQGIANGTGPNPAQAMLQQATGQNNAAQAALMAGQRGASQNAGLIARQAGQQGAANEQNMISQGANMQAQQSLNALGAMGNIAGQQVGFQQGALTGANQAAQGYQQNILGSIANQNNANVNMQGNINSTNAGVAAHNADTQGKIFGGITNALGSAATMLADGGAVGAPAASHVHQYFNGYAVGGPVNPLVGEAYAHSMQPVPGTAFQQGDSAKNDTVPAMLSPGEIIIPRSHAMDPMKAAAFAHAVSLKMSKGMK
jgi:hypothetical protein